MQQLHGRLSRARQRPAGSQQQHCPSLHCAYAAWPTCSRHTGTRHPQQHRRSRSSSTIRSEAATPSLALTVADPQQQQGGAPLALSTHRPDGDVLIEFRDVYKSFGDKVILRGASFSIRRGEAVGIIGASGTGKSTSLRLAAGLLAPDKGTILINGQPRTGLLSDKADNDEGLRIGMVFQNAALFDSLTVGENVGFLLYEHSSLPHAVIRQHVRLPVTVTSVAYAYSNCQLLCIRSTHWCIMSAACGYMFMHPNASTTCVHTVVPVLPRHCCHRLLMRWPMLALKAWRVCTPLN